MIDKIIDHLLLFAVLQPEDVTCVRVHDEGSVLGSVMQFEFINTLYDSLLLRLLQPPSFCHKPRFIPQYGQRTEPRVVPTRVTRVPLNSS